MKIIIKHKHTVRVTNAIALALGWDSGEEKRCGDWGFVIGNAWAKTRKDLHEIMLPFVPECGNVESLLKTKDRFGFQMFFKENYPPPTPHEEIKMILEDGRI
jgi:hypothetical protein